MRDRSFNCNTVKEAIKDKKETKTVGPNKVAPIHLHNMSPIALRYFTDIINLSVNTATILTSGKLARLPKYINREDLTLNLKASHLIFPP